MDTGVEFDRWTHARAANILPPELLVGPHHQVQDKVAIRGPQYVFTVASNFGPFQALNRSRLRRLIKEINAIASTKAAANTESFNSTFQESATEPFSAFKQLVLHPVDTMTRIPQGLWTFVTTSETALHGGRSQYADTYLQALVTVSKFKRRYAAELQIDVYTSNPMVQVELNRLGWAAVTANWTPSILLLPVTGLGKAIYTTFDWTKTLNDLITEAAPDVLRHRNDQTLEAMGVPASIRNDFLGHKFYSPRNQTVITEYLAKMKEAKGKSQVIEMAIHAQSEIDAFTFQQIIEIMAGYHRSRSPIVEFMAHKGIPVGYANNGSLVMGFPVDIGRWTNFSAYLFADFGNTVPESVRIQKRELWILGEMTTRARLEFYRLGIDVTEKVDSLVGMVD